MLDGLLQLISNLESYSPEKDLRQVLTFETKDIITAVQTQLSLGLDGNDEPVTLYGEPFYHPITIKNKIEFGKDQLARTVDRITNYMTGQFYSSLYLKIYENGNFEVSSDDPLFPLIKERSGDAIVDLSPTSMQFLFEEKIKPLFENQLTSLFYI